MPAPLTWYNIGPLTTDFTAPPQCTKAYFVDDPKHNTELFAGLASSCSLGFQNAVNGHKDNFDCWPLAASSYSLHQSLLDKSVDHSTIFVYSPGLRCPSGWTPAASWVRDERTNIPADQIPNELITDYYSQLWNTLSVGQTWVECCPLGFNASGNSDSCRSTYFRSSTYTAYSYTSGCGESTYTYTPLTERGNVFGAVGAKRLHLIVPSGSEFVQPSITNVPGNSPGNPPGNPPNNPTGSSLNDGTSEDDGQRSSAHGLSTSAKIAIGVVIPVVFLAAAALGLFFLLRYRRKRLGSSKQFSARPELDNQQITEVDGGSSKHSGPVMTSELHGQPVTELESKTNTATHELQGSEYKMPKATIKENQPSLTKENNEPWQFEGPLYRGESQIDAHAPKDDTPEDLKQKIASLRAQQADLESKLAESNKKS